MLPVAGVQRVKNKGGEPVVGVRPVKNKGAANAVTGVLPRVPTIKELGLEKQNWNS